MTDKMNDRTLLWGSACATHTHVEVVFLGMTTGESLCCYLQDILPKQAPKQHPSKLSPKQASARPVCTMWFPVFSQAQTIHKTDNNRHIVYRLCYIRYLVCPNGQIAALQTHFAQSATLCSQLAFGTTASRVNVLGFSGRLTVCLDQSIWVLGGSWKSCRHLQAYHRFPYFSL